MRITMTSTEERFLRLPEVITRVGLSRSQIYRLMARGEFPMGVRLGMNSTRWTASSINSWIAERINSHQSFAQAA
ncbi:helix-turn-helix transcriptional regulator [Occallatibacter riparius]|uniref:helix-turn-helix transcriptional regulator n=1 Tax=Occallatibacter riparius TaxID=1002689 RepID=UPI0036F3CA9F